MGRTHSVLDTAAGDVGDGKKALFLLYVEANSISLGADLTQYVAPDARYALETMLAYHRGHMPGQTPCTLNAWNPALA